MKITIKNVRSIADAVLEVPDKGFVQFIGSNSHGKSVLADVISRLCSKDIMDKDNRVNNIIKKGTTCAIFGISRGDGVSIGFRITPDRVTSLLRLTRKDGTQVDRTLREGGWDSLIEEFGFMVYGQGDLVIQVQSTFGKMPFITTDKRLDFDIVESISIDSKAKDFVDYYKGVTHAAGKRYVQNIDSTIASKESSLSSLIHYDVDAYAEMEQKIDSALKTIGNISTLTLKKITLPPNVSWCDGTCELLKQIPIIKTETPLELLTPMVKTLTDLKTLRERRCPLCERDFF